MSDRSERWYEVDTLLVTGDYMNARRSIEEVQAKYTQDWTAADEMDACIRSANIATKLGRYGEAAEHSRAGLRLHRPALAGRSAELHAWAAIAEVAAGRPEQAQTLIEQGLALLDASPDVEGTPRGGVMLDRAMGNLRAVEGRLREAVEACERSLKAVERLDDDWERSIARFNLGDAYARLGHHAMALEHLEAARQEKEAIGDRWGLAHVHDTHVLIHLDRHEWEQGREQVEAGLALAEEVGDPKLIASLQVKLARLTFRTGQFDEAERIGQDALQRAEQCGASCEQLQARILSGFVALARDRYEEAVSHADFVLRSAESGHLYAELADSQRLAALALARDNRVDDARAALEFALPLIRTLGNPYRRLEMEVAQIEVEMRAGQSTEQLLERVARAADRSVALSATWQRELLDRLVETIQNADRAGTEA